MLRHRRLVWFNTTAAVCQTGPPPLQPLSPLRCTACVQAARERDSLTVSTPFLSSPCDTVYTLRQIIVSTGRACIIILTHGTHTLVLYIYIYIWRRVWIVQWLMVSGGFRHVGSPPNETIFVRQVFFFSLCLFVARKISTTAPPRT